ncbi:hypothetical protein CKO_04446 [Citrobacter koseri ATCC BAA-895]|uniref:Uncharacterized protein n=1 Tax=Citrobacter koseri (strain ATCC BAA-895 / CDC 4225-83 / SGSC4696) TaxID=290338 RepID=A8APT9_CITK8|nr:hypothetical protein CKO_04446 [Citrobacter koseri ATCC BAA-895]
MAAFTPYPAYGSILLPDGGVNALSGLRFDFVAGWRRKCLIRPTVRFCCRMVA